MMLTSKLLTGKVVLITGCNRGIGKEIVETFALNGASIWACARKETIEFKNFIDEVSIQHNVPIRVLYFDLTNELFIKKSLNILVSEKVKIDILL